MWSLSCKLPPPTSNASMDYSAAKSYLSQLRRPFTYGLERITALCDALGHPERRFPIIHVAGTNGKGSVCAMLEAIYRKAGCKTGLYTSPSLVRLEERMQINRRAISTDDFARYTSEIASIATALASKDTALHPSFFDFLTGMAFCFFAENAVDVGIIETGLGGRLDSTNVVDPEIAVITSISLEHVEFLGNSLTSIAREKAGIIKAKKPVVIGCLPHDAEAVVRATARQRNASVLSVNERFGAHLEPYPQTNLQGRSQRLNAAAALCTVEHLQDRFPVSIAQATTALSSVDWPGHWQQVLLHSGKQLIFDRTHNAGAASDLDGNLQHLRNRTGRRPIVLTRISNVLRAGSLMPVIARHAQKIIALMPSQPNSPSLCLEALRQTLTVDFHDTLQQASLSEVFPEPYECQLGSEGEVIVVTGSIYLIGEVMGRLFEGLPPNEDILPDILQSTSATHFI